MVKKYKDQNGKARVCLAYQRIDCSVGLRAKSLSFFWLGSREVSRYRMRPPVVCKPNHKSLKLTFAGSDSHKDSLDFRLGTTGSNHSNDDNWVASLNLCP